MTTTATKPPSITDYVDIVDPSMAAAAYLADLSEDELRSQLFPIVRGRIASLQRARVRAVEDQVFGGNGAGPAPTRLPVDLVANRLKLTGETFPLADGRRIKWLEATAAEHRERAAMQSKLAGQCLIDSDRHIQAAELIEQYGVTCLAELPEDVTT